MGKKKPSLDLPENNGNVSVVSDLAEASDNSTKSNPPTSTSTPSGGKALPRIEHWPLPSWPADDPNRLKLRDLEVTNSRALGSGDQGTVYFAKHKLTGKNYAVKELISNSEKPDEVKETFRRELLTLYQQVDTSHVLRVYDVYVSSVKMKLLMELMDLGSLVDVLTSLREQKLRPACDSCGVEKGYCACPIVWENKVCAEAYGRLCCDDLKHVAYSIVHALHSIHSKKILHRDLKPSNVLADTSGVVKVCDFGVSRLLGDGGVAMTTTGSQLYFAPERVTNKKGYEYKADVWSVGVLLAYSALGVHPIPGKLFDVLTQVTSDEFSMTLPKEECSLDLQFVDFVTGCCRPDPGDRPMAVDLLQHEFLKGFIAEHNEENPYKPKFLAFVKPKEIMLK